MDIVDRLRQRIGLVKFDSDAIALRDAADIIEQLRGQVEFESECRNGAYADLEKQDAEIERLRKILEDVLETSGEQIPYGTVKAIRTALKEKE
jgi:hypothetical protein